MFFCKFNQNWGGKKDFIVRKYSISAKKKGPGQNAHSYGELTNEMQKKYFLPQYLSLLWNLLNYFVITMAKHIFCRYFAWEKLFVNHIQLILLEFRHIIQSFEYHICLKLYAFRINLRFKLQVDYSYTHCWHRNVFFKTEDVLPIDNHFIFRQKN